MDAAWVISFSLLPISLTGEGYAVVGVVERKNISARRHGFILACPDSLAVDGHNAGLEFAKKRIDEPLVKAEDFAGSMSMKSRRTVSCEMSAFGKSLKIFSRAGRLEAQYSEICTQLVRP